MAYLNGDHMIDVATDIILAFFCLIAFVVILGLLMELSDRWAESRETLRREQEQRWVEAKAGIRGR